MTDKHAAFKLSVSIGIAQEMLETEPPKSARWNRLRAYIESGQRVLDLYRWEHFQPEDCEKAGEIIDALNVRIGEMYTT